MPIHEYVCTSCRAAFEELVRGDEQVHCPRCGSSRSEKKLSTFALARAGSDRPRAQPAPSGPGACGTCGDPRGPGSCST